MEGAPAPFGFYTDRYELAMAWTHWRDGRAEEPAVFDYFFRELPFESGYAIFAGLATLLEALEDYRFSEGQLGYLEAAGFEPAFLDYLRDFTFEASLWAPPEGEIVFPNEPILRVEGGLIEAQIIETLVLNLLNFQTLIATKSARCREAAGDRHLSEFGLRRAQGPGGRWASRAACIGGFDSTSNLDAALAYDLPSSGTMAHAFIQSHEAELSAFRSFAAVHGSRTVLLLDTYDTLQSGLPNALIVARELRARGERLAGVRLDSGDLAYLAIRVREALDAEGFQEVRIVVSNQLDEHVIRSLLLQRAPIDVFGVGTSVATGAPDGALGGVYKMAMCDGKPRLKASETLAKSTLPGRKHVLRFTDEDGRIMADAILLAEESTCPRMLDPFEPLRQLDLSRWKGEPLLRPVLSKGQALGVLPPVREIAGFVQKRLKALPVEHRRFENPHAYKVGASPQLCALRDRLLAGRRAAFS